MFKCQEDRVAVLGVGVETPQMTGRCAELDFHSAHGGRNCIEMLRVVHFDLVLVGTWLADMSVWNFLRHVRTAWPQQKWALVGGGISEQEEIKARMLGATTIFDTTPDGRQLMDLTNRLRERARARVMSGRCDGAAASGRGMRVAV